MSMGSIREAYGVPAKRGMQIKYRNDELIIVGSKGDRLSVRFTWADKRYTFRIHPTWDVTYPEIPEGGA